jgi:hypothetical protein
MKKTWRAATLTAALLLTALLADPLAPPALAAVAEGAARDVIRILETEVVGPVHEAFGATFTFTMGDPWITAQPVVAAAADRSATAWDVSFFGPGLRHPRLTRDAFALLLCHELGHHFGGEPRKRLGPEGKPRWAAAEGQADFYATAVCTKRFFALAPAGFFDSFGYPSEVVDYCAQGSPRRSATLDCARSVLAAQVFVETLSDRATDWRVSDPTRAPRTVGLDPDPRDGHYEYPSEDCRMQTLREGARCYRLVSPGTGDLLGRGTVDPYCERPSCWYHAGT